MITGMDNVLEAIAKAQGGSAERSMNAAQKTSPSTLSTPKAFNAVISVGEKPLLPGAMALSPSNGLRYKHAPFAKDDDDTLSHAATSTAATPSVYSRSASLETLPLMVSAPSSNSRSENSHSALVSAEEVPPRSVAASVFATGAMAVGKALSSSFAASACADSTTFFSHDTSHIDDHGKEAPLWTTERESTIFEQLSSSRQSDGGAPVIRDAKCMPAPLEGGCLFTETRNKLAAATDCFLLHPDDSVADSGYQQDQAEDEGAQEQQQDNLIVEDICVQQGEEEEDERDDSSVDAPLSLFPFLRKAKVLKIAINEVLLLQQQTSYLLLLHPSGGAATSTPPAFCSGCRNSDWPEDSSGGSDATTGMAACLLDNEKEEDLCNNCELALHVNTAQHLLLRTHDALQQLQQQQLQDEQQWELQQEQQQQQNGGVQRFVKHMQRQQAAAASAAELRIRRSVLRQQQQQLQVALEQQHQLEDDLKARWEAEVVAEMQILCPEAGRPLQVHQALQRLEERSFSTQSACSLPSLNNSDDETATATNSATTAATSSVGTLRTAEALAAKCRQLEKLQSRLLEVQSMMAEVEKEKELRERQLFSIATAAVDTKQNTAAAVQDMLLARKYQRRAFRHSLFFVGTLVALFLFFFIPSTPLLPLLFLFHGERPSPSSPM